MQAPPAAQLCDSGGLSVLWKVFTGPCWCGADVYSGEGNEDSSTQVERLDCSGLPEGPLSHWIQCAKSSPPRGLYLTLFAQLILEAGFWLVCFVAVLYGHVLNPLKQVVLVFSLWRLGHGREGVWGSARAVDAAALQIKQRIPAGHISPVALFVAGSRRWHLLQKENTLFRQTYEVPRFPALVAAIIISHLHA